MTDKNTVIIDLEESERTQTGELSEIVSVEASGVLSVKNVSDKNRIWNVRVHVAGSRDKTSISEDVIGVGEVDAGGTWQTQYQIQIDRPILTLTETFDTCCSVSTPEAHWAYVHGKENPVRITLRVKNESDGQLDALVINKTVPPELSNIRIENVQSGNASFDESLRVIVWKDFIIYPHEDSVLTVTATGTVDTTDPKNAGEVSVTYRGESLQRSSLDPDLTALTDFMTGIENAETQPNQWESTLECHNDSSLMVRLDKAEVFLTPEDGGERRKMIDAAPHAELAPGATWSEKFQVASKTPPKCTHEVVYTPMRTVTKRVLGVVKKTAQTIPVACIEYVKAFDPPEVNSFDKTPVEVTIEVKNTGSARLNEVVIEDHLPDDVMPPKREHIRFWVAGTEYKSPVGITIEPEDQDPTKPHKLTFRLTDLKDSVGELRPGQSVKVNYAIMAWRNRPEKEYPSPIHCKANTFPAGLYAEAASAQDGHKLGIVYKKRAISVKKGINKGANAGEYNVVLAVENKGQVTVENVRVTDWVPAAFSYVSTEPVGEEPVSKPATDGTIMEWTWARMNPGEAKRLTVTVRGSGEYERREPEVVSD